METVDRPVLRSRAWLIAAGILVGLLLTMSMVGWGPPTAELIALTIAGVLALGAVLWALVRSRRERRDYENELTAWAAERSAQAERLRIARDLHDLASHGLGVITVRAAAVRTLAGAAGDAERIQALADIEKAGRQATTELRRMLGVLRSSSDEPMPRRPAETLSDLPAVVTEASASGIAPVLDIHDLDEVSAGVQLTVCAVVREALANVARHAGPTGARVTLRRTGDDVLVTVEDDGPAPGWRPHRGAGRGLTGLQERVQALGGTLDAAPHENGFRLTARMPDPAPR